MRVFRLRETLMLDAPFSTAHAVLYIKRFSDIDWSIDDSLCQMA